MIIHDYGKNKYRNVEILVLNYLSMYVKSNPLVPDVH